MVRARQVRLRLQWVTEERRGRALRCEVALAGAALSVVGALQDELFNATLDRVSVVAERSRAEARSSLRTSHTHIDKHTHTVTGRCGGRRLW